MTMDKTWVPDKTRVLDKKGPWKFLKRAVVVLKI